ncbi:MAG: A24 family peptidase [Clostridiales bacterium]|nr:A24 family peptidase [Clostridiales bacterium]
MRIGSCIVIYVSLFLLFVAVVSDLCSGKIPNWWICTGVAAAGVLTVWPGLSPGWPDFLSGLVIPLLIGWIPFRMGALGAGDVKLLMVIGCLNGGREIFYCIFLSFLLAAGISLGRLLSLRQFKDSLISCIRYFQSVFLQRRIELYPGRGQKGHTIHFSMAIFGGYVMWLGVSTCRFIL